MLDVSIRTGVMHLMESLAERLGISYLYITHDLAVARFMCSRIAVMYLGKIVEMGETEAVLQQPSTRIRRLCCQPCQSRSDRFPSRSQNRRRGLDSAGSAGPLPVLQPLPYRGRLLPQQPASAAGGEGEGQVAACYKA